MSKLGVMVVILMASASIMLQQSPVASACDVLPQFDVAGDDLILFDGHIEQRYRDWVGNSTASFEMLGVYVEETIFAIEPEGAWTRGSVSVTTDVWGVWPDETGPTMIMTEDQTGPPPTNCGWDAGGEPLGTKQYRVVTTQGVFDLDPTDFESLGVGIDGALTLAFGTPETAPRDRGIETDLIAQLEASRSSSTLLFVGIGAGALILAGAAAYLTRRSRGGETPA